MYSNLDVRISEKPLLSLMEAVAYTGIGRDTLMRLASDPNCKFVLYIGRKRLYKRRLLEEFIESSYSI